MSCNCRCSTQGSSGCIPCQRIRFDSNCCKPHHTPWCLPCCPPRMTPKSSPFCGPKCYTHPCCRCCSHFNVSKPSSKCPNFDQIVPPPRACPSSLPYGACNCVAAGARHWSYSGCCGNGRCSSGYYKYSCC